MFIVRSGGYGNRPSGPRHGCVAAVEGTAARDVGATAPAAPTSIVEDANLPGNVTLDLSPDSPQTPQRTAELACWLVQIVRALNESTADGDASPAPGIGWPVCPEDLLDRLAQLAEGTEQLYPQLATALRRHHGQGAWRAAPVNGVPRDLDAELATAADHLHEASVLASGIARHLLQARNLLSSVHPAYPGPDSAAEAEPQCAEPTPRSPSSRYAAT